jgi:hypothetical protein
MFFLLIHLIPGAIVGLLVFGEAFIPKPTKKVAPRVQYITKPVRYGDEACSLTIKYVDGIQVSSRLNLK